MGKQFNELEKYINELEKFTLPSFDDLPDIPLYMEQVIGYVKEALRSLKIDENTAITPFMVNNYVKAKIIEGPKDKKYTKDHIGYLVAISLMKSVVSMRDVATLIDIDSELGSDTNNIYNIFKEMQEDAIRNVVHKVKVRSEFLKKNEKKVKANLKGKKSSEQEQVNLAYIALKLYVDSEANKLIADHIMANLGKDILPESVINETEDITKYDRKKTSKTAKKLADR